jgi:PAS domain S-box-containing protein
MDNLKRIQELQETLFGPVDDAINIIDEIPICIHEIDLDGKLTKMNKAGLEMIGCVDQCEIQGVDYFSFVSEESLPDVRNHWKIAQSGETTKFIFNSSAGKIYSSCFTPMIKNGKIYKIIGFTQDITEYG